MLTNYPYSFFQNQSKLRHARANRNRSLVRRPTQPTQRTVLTLKATEEGSALTIAITQPRRSIYDAIVTRVGGGVATRGCLAHSQAIHGDAGGGVCNTDTRPGPAERRSLLCGRAFVLLRETPVCVKRYFS